MKPTRNCCWLRHVLDCKDTTSGSNKTVDAFTNSKMVDSLLQGKDIRMMGDFNRQWAFVLVLANGLI